MAYFHPITEEQKALLNSFTCERLTDDLQNIWRIERFHSERVQGMVECMQRDGWIEDTKGSIAHYVIKNPAGQILMFFSLKCGVLFDSHSIQSMLNKHRNSKIWPYWVDYNGGGTYRNEKEKIEAENKAKEEIGRWLRNFSYEQRTILYRELNLCWKLHQDAQEEANPRVIHASKSFPAVELVNLCANDRTKMCWDDYKKEYNMPSHRKMGEVLFWWFIVPKMLEVSKLVGCEYAYLFAADESDEGFLMKYYETSCRFRRLSQLGAVKPFYDINCWFMGTRLRTISPSMASKEDYAYFERDDEDVEDENDYLLGLDYYREEFFADFNLTEDGPAMDGSNQI